MFLPTDFPSTCNFIASFNEFLASSFKNNLDSANPFPYKAFD